MKALLKLIAVVLFFPHLIIIFLKKNAEVVKRDIIAQQNLSNNYKFRYQDLAYELFINKYYRTLFYHRFRGNYTSFLKVFYRGEKSFYIDVSVKIGGGIKLAHPYSTIINAVELGENVYVNHLVTIGEKNGGKPIIGSNVQIHAGAIIIGSIKIEDNAIIGAGAVVTKDVPKGAVVVGNPSRILNL